MATPLGEMYRGFICDLDGVVYTGAQAVPHAVDSLEAVHATGRMIAFATNNAARPPHEVGDHLRSLGITVDDAYVLNSSQAGARRAAELLPAGSRVLAVGGPGVSLALTESGLVPVRASELLTNDNPEQKPVAAVLQGFGPDVSWRDLSQAAFAIQRGALWIATNTDTTLPLAEGLAPGNGALVGALAQAVTIDPVVVGKPYAPLYEYCAAVLGTDKQQTLALGDRLNTDIAGAVTCGIDSLWVFTGVSSAIEVALADPSERPTYQATDLRALMHEYTPAVVTKLPEHNSWQATCGHACAHWEHGRLQFGGSGTANERLRVVIAAAWAARDGGVDIDAAALAPAGAWIDDAR